MKISTRSRYGLRLMVVLARHHGRGWLRLKDIAFQEDISEKYLSLLVMPLKAKGLIASGQGAHGGYTLSRSPKDISLLDIVETLEGGMNIVTCSRDPSVCRRSSHCPTQRVWTTLEDRMSGTLAGMSLDQLIKKEK